MLHKLYYCKGRKSVRNLLWERSHSMPGFLQIQHFVKLPVDTDREQIQFCKKCQENPEPTEWRLWEMEVVSFTYVPIVSFDSLFFHKFGIISVEKEYPDAENCKGVITKSH